MPDDAFLPPALPPAPTAADLLPLRAVHRAAGELRRGVPVLLRGPVPLVVLSADTAGVAGLAELAALAHGPVTLAVSPMRAAALLGRAVEPGLVAVGLRTDALSDPAVLRGLADPTAAQLLHDPIEAVPAPDGAGLALALAKIARVLPAVLVAPASTAAAEGGLLAVDGTDVAGHPDREASALVRVATASVPLEEARNARVVAFRAPDGGIEHLAILVGEPETATGPVLCRLHSECFTGDLLGSLRCDCGPQLRGALRRMGEAGCGVLLYLAQEGRGIGLANKLRAYALQDRGLDTVDANRALGWLADERNFNVAATMLRQLGVGTVRLLTNNPDKVAALEACGIVVAGRERLVIPPNGLNDAYLQTKAGRMGHLP